MSEFRVLAFDSWTGGAHHIEALVEPLAALGISVRLVHLGSWGNDSRPSLEEMKGKLQMRDIAWYGSNSFEKVLDAEKPDAVVLLSTATFAHRAFLRYCKQRGIPSLHLYHSLMSVQVTDDHVGSVEANPLAYAKLVISMLGKLITKTFPCYIGALLKTRAKADEWVRFVRDVIKLAIGRPIWQPNVAADAGTTKCAVYVEADRAHASRVYGLDMQDVVAVGNPDLMRFGLSAEHLCAHPRRAATRRPNVVYLDTGLATFGLVFRNLQGFVDHLKHTSDALAAQGYSMCFKPHPAHNRQDLERSLADSNVRLISNPELLPELLDCTACLAEMSSLTIVPVVMGVPLLFANYGELSGLRFGPLLQAYPRGYAVRNLDDVRSILQRDQASLDEVRLQRWVSVNSGPMPAEHMPRRVAELILQMIQGSGAATLKAASVLRAVGAC